MVFKSSLFTLFNVILLVVITSIPSLAQTSGGAAYRFLEVVPVARLAALGGALAATPDSGIELVWANPASLRSQLKHNTSIGYTNLFGDIKMGNALFSPRNQGKNPWAFGFTYLDYGNFVRANALGEREGDFTANEMALIVSRAMTITDHWHIGFNFKTVFSSLEQEHSFGIAADAGILYSLANKGLTMGLVLKNAGWQAVPYFEGQRESLPFNLQFGMRKKMAHAPFAISIQAHDLLNPDLGFKAEKVDDLGFSNLNQSSSPFFDGMDQAFRHINFAVELFPSSPFQVYLAYNHKVRRELAPESNAGLTGFSMGFQLTTRRVQIQYGFVRLNPAAASHLFTLGFRI